MITKTEDCLILSENLSDVNTKIQKRTVTADAGSNKKHSSRGRIVKDSFHSEGRTRYCSSCRSTLTYPGSELSRFDVIKKASSKYHTLDRDMIAEAWEKVVRKQIS